MSSVSLAFEPRPGADAGDLSRLHRAIRESVRGFLNAYPTQGALEDGAVANDAPVVQGTTLTFVFPDTPPHVAVLAPYWFRLGVACVLGEIDAAASDVGMGWSGPRPRVREVLKDAPAGLVDSDRVSELLRPEEDFARSMRDHLATGEDRFMLAACWYLSNVATLDAATLEALLQAAAHASDDVVRGARRAISRVAGQGTITELLRPHFHAPVAARRAAALAAVAPLHEAGELDDEQAYTLLRDAMDGPPRVAESVAEALARVPHPAGRKSEVVDALLGLLGRADATPDGRHGALLSLVNLHLQTREVPPDVMVAFERAASQPSPWQGLADWAVTLFDVVE